MVIAVQREALKQDLKAIVDAPYRHALPPVDGRVSLDSVLEVLVGSGRWVWLARQDLDEVLWAVQEIPVQDGDLIVGGRGPLPPIADRIPDPTYVPRTNVRGGPLRGYQRLDYAFAAAAAVPGDLGLAAVSRISPPAQGLPAGQRAALCEWQVVLIEQPGNSTFLDVTPDLSGEAMMKFRIRLWLDEIRNLSDLSTIGDAAGKLYSVMPQIDAERLLTPLLRDADPEVRSNGLLALGRPAYKVPFVPGAPVLPRNERLEPATLAPETVEAIIGLIQAEADEAVLDHAVCTLSAQNFEGKLREQGFRIRDILRRRLPTIESESTRKDAGLLLQVIPLH